MGESDLNNRNRVFVTVGTQLPFDRLIRYFDEWNGLARLDGFVQYGVGGEVSNTLPGAETLLPKNYKEKIENTDLLVSHAGIGSILTAIEYNIPAVLVPRSMALGEHRNDHQSSTKREFEGVRGIYFASGKEEFFELMNGRGELSSPSSEVSSSELMANIEKFIEGGL